MTGNGARGNIGRVNAGTSPKDGVVPCVRKRCRVEAGSEDYCMAVAVWQCVGVGVWRGMTGGDAGVCGASKRGALVCTANY
jgi:hypothetical protein